MAAFDPRCFVYPVTFLRWIDGDTAVVSCNLGMRTRWEGSARVVGINCPELHTPGGYEAHAFARQLVPEGTTRPCRSVALDNFGRPLIAIDLGTTAGFEGFAQAMLEAHMAEVYQRDLDETGFQFSWRPR